MPAANSEPSYAVTLVRFRDNSIGNEFAPLRLRQSLFDRGACFIVQAHDGRFLACVALISAEQLIVNLSARLEQHDVSNA
jgi:hypothetical protein